MQNGEIRGRKGGGKEGGGRKKRQASKGGNEPDRVKSVMKW